MARKPDRPDQTDEEGASFADRLVADPKNVPDLMLLYGYPGASSEDGHERLYLSPDLANYIEIPASAILHRLAAPKEQDPNGGTTLWVRKDAALIYKMAPAAQALAHFFAGAIQAQGPAPAMGAPALTLGGPVCGVTLPHICQIATARCTRNTCGVACTAAGPCLTQVADCQTQAATCACTDFGCQTDVTPCINTHVFTCGACPSVNAVCQSVGGCQSAGADCTFIGCGHTLACTQGLLCRGAAQAAPAATVGGPQCGLTVPPNVCQVTIANTCGFACTAFVQCQTHVATCQPCASVNPTCGPFCTVLACPTVHNTCPTPCSNFTPCISVANPNCRTPFKPCITNWMCPSILQVHCPPDLTVQVTCPPQCFGQGMQPQQAMRGGEPAFTAWCGTAGCFSPMCTGFQCNTPAQPCTPNCPQ